MQSGQTILLTGATSGIGEAAAIEFAKQGQRLFLTARNPAKAEATEAKIRKQAANAEIQWLYGDFASLDDVRKIAEEFLALDEPLDVLFSNAGIVSPKRVLTADGYESMFAVNHLAPFLLSNLLLDKLASGAGEARVVFTASDAHKFVRKLDLDNLNAEKGFNGMSAYGHSKLANILCTQSLASKLPALNPDKQFAINSFHPGFVGTSLGTDTWLGKFAMKGLKPFIRSGLKGAESGLYLASAASIAGCSGGYYYNCKPRKLKPYACDAQVAEGLWQKSLAMTGLA